MSPFVAGRRALSFRMGCGRIAWLCVAGIVGTGTCGRARGQPAPAAPVSHLQFDLTLGLRTPLVSTSYDDEGVVTPADAGKSIVRLPFPVAALAAMNREFLVGQSTVKIDTNPPRKRAKLIGFQSLAVRDGRPVATTASGAVYERLMVKPSHRSGTSVEGINALRPVKRKPAAPGGPPLRNAPTPHSGAPVTLSAGDWLALLIETDPGLEYMDIFIHREPAERIDLAYLARAHEPLVLTDRTPLDHPLIQDTFRVAASSSGPMAALALARLGTWRLTAPVKTPPAVLAGLCDHMAGGLAAGDARAREAAWDGLARGAAAGPHERNAISRAAAAARANLITLAARDLAKAAGPRRSNILALVNDAWRVADKAECGRVLDLVVADGGPDAFTVLDGATPTGVDALFSRLHAESRMAIKAGLARALLGQTTVEREPTLLAEARDLRLEIVDPADPIFKRFDEANDPRTRMAILRALAVVSTAAVRHTTELARFIESATGKRQDAAVREAAFSMVVAQAMATVSGGERQPSGAFPLSAPSSGQDGLTAGLANAVQDGSPGTRTAALAALVLRGEARAAADAIRGLRLGPEGMAALLGKLQTRPGVARSDGLFALLMILTAASDRASSAVVLRQAEAAADRYPRAQSWRMAAAMRAGMDWPRMAALSADRDSRIAVAALRFLGTAGHLPKSDVAALGAAKQGDRATLLARFNADAYAKIDGRYGCLLLVETIEPLDPARFGASAVVRWGAPLRAELFGPIVEIRSSTDGYVVAAAGGQIGRGRPTKVEPSLPTRGAWPPALGTPTWKLPGVGLDRNRSPVDFSPLALSGAAVLSEGGEGALNINAAELVRAGLANAAAEPMVGLSGGLAESFQVTLRPVGFGALAGVGPSMPPASPAGSTPAAVLNILVILQPLD